ncbi:STN domain-containing protein [Dyella caseinilytica]|uniref:Secretin/TonB short N-terminal domain-containing protein n=1 Tax=Dyella caseinilytica TaxID=1849581 RepID=A0ABX7GT66_9GAMM|nr:STN domain-containing protein [Dyella caseinilytica]QRN53636.1 hypothetical protein ISN74_19905 [Dyella caseinilytica]GFZ88090.1 hypothetical protein GCM10011408_03430 [Dyella caseinilytica]
MLKRLIYGLMKRLPMLSNDRAAGYVIRCHIVGIVSTLALGGYSACGAFDIKGLKCFTLQRFIGLVLGSALTVLSPVAAGDAAYQAVPAANEPAGQFEVGNTIAFDIPPQPLLTALRAYSELTGQAVLVDNVLATGRQSPGVRGEFDRIEALTRLLAGTGLVASYSSDEAFTLKLAESGETGVIAAQEKPEAMQVGGIDAVTERYAGKIQHPIETALCQSDRTRPGTYRLAMQIWVAPSGKVERTQLLTSMRNTQRENEVRNALDSLTLDPPPVDMPQPITLLLLPGRPGSACAGALPPQG